MFQKMLQGGGGGNKTEIANGEFKPNMSNFTDVNCGFQPTKVHMYFTSGGKLLHRIWDVVNNTFYQKVGGEAQVDITQFVGYCGLTNNGFKYKAISSDDSVVTFYMAIKE